MNIINTSTEKFERWLEASHRRDIAVAAHAVAEEALKKAHAKMLDAKVIEATHWSEVQAMRTL